jgi:hypothetical protein
MRHIGDAQRLIAFHRAVDDVDGIATKHGIDDGPWPPGPAFNLVLPHAIDELALIRGRHLREIPSEKFVAGLVNRGNRGAVELREGRTDIEDAGLKQGFVRRHRKLLIDEVRDPGLTRLRHQCLPQRLQGFPLMGIKQPKRDATRPRLSGRHDDLGTPYRKCQCPECRAFHKAASADVRHRHLLPE